MRPNELSIGDWVWNEFNHQPEQVVELRERQVMLAYNDLYDYDDIKPLTPSDYMMRRNGFTEDGALRHWWRKYEGERKISVYLHEVMGRFFTYDYWIDQPFDMTRQTLFSSSIREMGDLFVCKKQARSLTAGCADGIHLLQHAMNSAGIDFEWDMTPEPKPEKQEEISPGQYEWILDINTAAHMAWRGLPLYTADKCRPIDECSTIDTSMVHWVKQNDGTYLTWSAQRLIDMLPERLNYYLENDLRLQHYRHGDVYVVKYESDAQILECRSSNLLDALRKMYDRLLPDSHLKSQIDFKRWQ